MPRNMSFSATVPQILDRSKTVTRRKGWTFLKPGDRLWAVEKAMGLKKGEKARRLALIEVGTVRREPLSDLITHISYGDLEAKSEGFPSMNGAEFVNFYCELNKCSPSTWCTRIAFGYVDEEAMG